MRASTHSCPFEVCDSVAGRLDPGIAGAGEGRGGEGVLCGAGGVAGGSGRWVDVVVAGGGGGWRVRSRTLRVVVHAWTGFGG